MEKVKDLLKEIQKSNSKGSSRGDEVKVMKAMLNDKDFKVGVYDSNGKTGDFSPSETARGLVRDIVVNTTKVTKKEAETMAEHYVFSNADANKFVDISKEFINTYTDTGRKINLGKREKYNTSLIKKDVEAHERNFPKAIKNSKGEVTSYEISKVKVPAHTTMKAISKCPDHLKK